MCVRHRVVVLCVLGTLLLAGARAADAQTVLTLADVLARARERAPQIVSARLALEEARSRLPGASLRLPSNPNVDALIGDRRASGASGASDGGGAAGGRTTDYSFGLSQQFEPPSRRSARVAGVNAAIAQGTADVDDTRRLVLQAAASTFYLALQAGERIRLLSSAVELASDIHATAERRFKAGDIAILDVNIARASLARARADRAAAEAQRSEALGDLGQVLGLDGDLTVQGALDPPANADLGAALQSAALRPDLQVMEAAIREAEADVALGRSFARPDYGFSVRYGRDDGDRVVIGGMTVTLPLFAKGQELQAPGAARAARLRAELDASRAGVRIQVRAAFEAYDRRLEAVRVLQSEALPGLDENDALAVRSFDAGQIGLPDLLLIRREILETRVRYLDALTEAALARINLDASAGTLR